MLKQLFRWQRGRQQSGYDKMLLGGLTWPVPFDFYLLRFPTGSEIAPHIDAVESGRHYRINLIIKQARVGGDFICSECLLETKRIKYFRPDVAEHQVTRVVSGTRYVLSLGWVRR